MHALRTVHLARLVLAWFALTLGMAIASPVVDPVSMALVCSDGGVKLVAADHDDGAMPHHGALDCPLCLSGLAPPPIGGVTADVRHPLRHALLPARAAHIAALVGAPLPPRGPPAA